MKCLQDYVHLIYVLHEIFTRSCHLMYVLRWSVYLWCYHWCLTVMCIFPHWAVVCSPSHRLVLVVELQVVERTEFRMDRLVTKIPRFPLPGTTSRRNMCGASVLVEIDVCYCGVFNIRMSAKWLYITIWCLGSYKGESLYVNCYKAYYRCNWG